MQLPPATGCATALVANSSYMEALPDWHYRKIVNFYPPSSMARFPSPAVVEEEDVELKKKKKKKHSKSKKKCLPSPTLLLSLSERKAEEIEPAPIEGNNVNPTTVLSSISR